MENGKSSMPPEIRIVVRMLGRAAGGDLTPEELRALAASLDEEGWRRAWRCIRMTGLEGCFFHQFEELGQGGAGAPPWLVESCRRIYHENLYRGILFRTFFEEFSRWMEDAGMEFIPLKGINLLESLYPDMGWRSMGDIDVLVRREDVEAAERILEERGFSVGDRRLRERYLRFHHHLYFRGEFQGHEMALELHWAVARHYLPHLDYEHLWREGSHAVEGSTATERALKLSYLFLFLLAHTAQHHYRVSVKWLMDLFLLVGRGNLDGQVERILNLIRRNGFRKATFLVASLAGSTIDAGPEHRGSRFMQNLRASMGLSPLTGAVLDRLADPEVFFERAEFLRLKWPGHAYAILIRDGLPGVFRYASYILFWKLHKKGIIS
jgi:hypothetical protein